MWFVSRLSFYSANFPFKRNLPFINLIEFFWHKFETFFTKHSSQDLIFHTCQILSSVAVRLFREFSRTIMFRKLFSSHNISNAFISSFYFPIYRVTCHFHKSYPKKYSNYLVKFFYSICSVFPMFCKAYPVVFSATDFNISFLTNCWKYFNGVPTSSGISN